jgi:iron complex outermembrane receptor protein
MSLSSLLVRSYLVVAVLTLAPPVRAEGEPKAVLPEPSESQPASASAAGPAAPTLDPSAPAQTAPKKETAGRQSADETLVVVGTRREKGRTVTDSPVAIDVLDLSQLQDHVGQLDVNQLLMYSAPSFNANRQSGADGADHVDPATLRGLGPDQTLVLINGKRLHQSSLINLFGTRGRGNTGTDLDSIPAAAIERIEILRDGASAQYGSDAIAGVINVVLKKSTEELTAGVTGGTHNGKPPSKYKVLGDGTFDGSDYDAFGNYGFKLGKDGFLNLTAQYLDRGRTTRVPDPAAFDSARKQFGDAQAADFGTMLNGEVNIAGSTRAYAFGGYNYRNADAYAWTRAADDTGRNVPAIYANGFDPRITSQITDLSLSTGLKTETKGWDIDFNNTYGQNEFHYIIKNTLNASLGADSPTTFDAGGHRLSQNVTGLYVSRTFTDWLAGTNLAFGAERRLETYGIFAGEEGSYRNYGLVQSVDPAGQVTTIDTLGRARGSQGFPGFQPANVVNASRTNLAAYADVDADITSRVGLDGAVRFENYNDFGNTFNGKLAGRVNIIDGLSFRASASTGFRAPSLAQINFNTTFTDFVGGHAVDKMIFRNDSPIARTLGIPSLKQEKSQNLSAGLVGGFDAFTASVDAYYVAIQDRIVLTGNFDSTDPSIGSEISKLNVGGAQFFANALDTKTYGIDVVLGYTFNYGDHSFKASFAGNFNRMTLGTVKMPAKFAANSQEQEAFFGLREQKFLLASAPPMKLNLGLDYRFGSFGAYLRFVEFGQVELINWNAGTDVYTPRVTTDLSVSYQATENVTLVVGGENIFNVYPTAHDPLATESGGTWDAVQMGFSGAFYFARLAIKI